jgi:6-phospho-3-hexuloisomerase
MSDFPSDYQRTCRLVTSELTRTLDSIQPEQVERLVAAITAADRVFFVGVGRVLLSLQAVAKRWAHLGIDTHCVGEITEPAITDRDLLIVGSGSGTTMLPLGIARKAGKLGARVVHIGSNPQSELHEIAEFMVRIPVRTKLYLPDEIESAQPMTSLFEQSLLLLGDIIASLLIESRQLDLKDLWQHHANLE